MLLKSQKSKLRMHRSSSDAFFSCKKRRKMEYVNIPYKEGLCFSFILIKEKGGFLWIQKNLELGKK